MKRHLLLLAILSLIAAIPLTARERQTWDDQPYKYEVTVAIAPILDQNALYGSLARNVGNSSLDLMYAPEKGSVYTAGGYSAEFGLVFRKWFTLGFNLSSSGIWHYSYDNITRLNDRVSGAQVSIMSIAKLSWLHKRTIKMYSSFGVGGGFTVYNRKATPHLSYYFVPVGMQFGGKVYGIAEWGTGTNANMQAVRLGIGMKF